MGAEERREVALNKITKVLLESVKVDASHLTDSERFVLNHFTPLYAKVSLRAAMAAYTHGLLLGTVLGGSIVTILAGIFWR